MCIVVLYVFILGKSHNNTTAIRIVYYNYLNLTLLKVNVKLYTLLLYRSSLWCLFHCFLFYCLVGYMNYSFCLLTWNRSLVAILLLYLSYDILYYSFLHQEMQIKLSSILFFESFFELFFFKKKKGPATLSIFELRREQYYYDQTCIFLYFVILTSILTILFGDLLQR